MYKAGVIERAPYWNKYQSACFVVPKKSGQDRLVVDMRKVNQHILEEDFAFGATNTQNVVRVKRKFSIF